MQRARARAIVCLSVNMPLAPDPFLCRVYVSFALLPARNPCVLLSSRPRAISVSLSMLWTASRVRRDALINSVCVTLYACSPRAASDASMRVAYRFQFCHLSCV